MFAGSREIQAVSASRSKVMHTADCTPGGQVMGGCMRLASLGHEPSPVKARARRRPPPPCSMDRVMISVRSLGMRLESGGRPVDVLTDVTLEIPARQFAAIAGLDRPTTGRIVVNDVELTSLDEDDLARFRRDAIGYVFQSFHHIPTLTAL